MATASVSQNEETWDAHYSLRTTVRRQAQQLKVQEDTIAELKATTASLTAAVAALTDYLRPADGQWVYEEGQPAEYMPCEPSAPRYDDLLFRIPAEVLQRGR
jgi:hypothetical protein